MKTLRSLAAAPLLAAYGAGTAADTPESGGLVEAQARTTDAAFRLAGADSRPYLEPGRTR
jgi:uncharacterized protein YciI